VTWRLTARGRELLLECATVHLVEAEVVRVGTAWAAVGKDIEDQRRWSGLVVHAIDFDRGLVWWADRTFQQKRRGDVVRELSAAIQ
jgi:hypothetical protein